MNEYTEELSYTNTDSKKEKEIEKHIDPHIIELDIKKVLTMLPEKIRESDIGQAISSALDELKKSEEGYDQILFADCVKRIAYYFEKIKKEAIQYADIETTFVLGGVVNHGKGAFLAPVNVYHPRDMEFYPNAKQIDDHIKNAKVNIENETKYIRFDMSEQGKKILSDSFDHMAIGQISLGQEVIFDTENATVGTAQENTLAFFTVIHIAVDRIKDFINQLHHQ